MEILSLMDMVSAIENTADSTQIFLKDAMKEILYKSKGPATLTFCSELESIVSIGILQQTEGKYDISNAARKQARKLYTYLVRKFDTEPYLNEDCEMIEVPKGSIFECVVDVSSGKSSLSLQFPDDEITALLDLFDSNPCKYWGRK